MNSDFLTNPQNKYEQIQGIIDFYIESYIKKYKTAPYTYDLPSRLQAIALMMFDEADCSGYRAMVVRSAMKELETKGRIDYNSPMYTME